MSLMIEGVAGPLADIPMGALPARVWRADGVTGVLVSRHPATGVQVLVDGGSAPVCVTGDLARWVPAPACDYCDQPAELQLIDGDELLCGGCGRSQFERPGDWVRPIRMTVIRRLVAERVDTLALAA